VGGRFAPLRKELAFWDGVEYNWAKVGEKRSMAEQANLLARIAEKAGVDETEAEEVLADLVGELVTAKRELRPIVEIPPYFDRYVTTEILHLREDLSAFRAEMDRRFTEVDRRFSEMDSRFDRLERWFFVVGVPIILGILSIIAKVFFATP